MHWLLLHTAVAGLEICDGIDNDGDGNADEAPIAVFVDADGDGFGDPGSFTIVEQPCVTQTDPPPTDCDDAAGDVFPGADESCDGRDTDCNGTIDDGQCGPCQQEMYDGGSYLRCGQPLPRRSWPSALQFCIDRGYGLAVPEDASELVFLESIVGNRDRWLGLQDVDGDGTFLTWEDGQAGMPDWAPGEPLIDDGGTCALVQEDPPTSGLYAESCSIEMGWLCESACRPRAWYPDGDGDGQGAGTPVEACEAPVGHVAAPGDCDDDDPERHATATERCNNVDDDCDGLIDDDAPLLQAVTWYRDHDEDGAGDPDTAVVQCEAPVGYVADATDCDDLDPAVFPGADEVCNGIDDDCDQATDEDALDATDWFPDLDQDGFGAGTATLACEAPAGQVANADDCDDTNDRVNPDADEVCNGFDDDCDGAVDADDPALVDGIAFFTDADQDGIGAEEVLACSQPLTASLVDGDCDDGDATIFPGADEIGDDGIDQDCDGSDLTYVYTNGLSCGCQSTPRVWPGLLRR